jgi:aspartate aminotransferase-like enzyme
VTVVHSETSTGALADVRAVTALAREHGAVCLVDSVTGVGGVPLEFDAWDLDFALTGSQKALALPPGLAFAVASDRYLRTVEQAPARGVYFDLAEFVRFGAKHQTPNTPALSLLYALDRQLARIAEEGIEARWARHRAMAEQTWAWAERLGAELPGVRVAAEAGARTWTVSALTVPAGTTPAAIGKAMQERGYVIGDGYGKLRESTFRIGHMGDHTVEALGGCLAACEEALRA